jgi:hypothetical protein
VAVLAESRDGSALALSAAGEVSALVLPEAGVMSVRR